MARPFYQGSDAYFQSGWPTGLLPGHFLHHALIIAIILVCFFFPRTAHGAQLHQAGRFTSFTITDAKLFVTSLSMADSEELAVSIHEPSKGVVIPPDMAAPQIVWSAETSNNSQQHYKPGGWLVSVLSDGETLYQTLTSRTHWTPSAAAWQEICTLLTKSREEEALLSLRVQAIGGWDGRSIVGTATTSLRLSRDKLGAKIFFIRKPVPFSLGQAHPERTQWIEADLSKENPMRTVLQGVPVCGNCHAFSSGAGLVGMDWDIDGDKGAYLLTSATGSISATRDDIISWNDRLTPSPAPFSFGLFTSLSHNGRFAASTVGETSIFARMDDLAFSQLFFPATGRIGVFDRSSGNHFDLPGADLETMVQTAPSFSPDGRTLVFSRAPVDPDLVSAAQQGRIANEPSSASIFELNKKYSIQFDIWTLPFNEGKGGEPRPLKGASNNGFSNYFGRYSPDGKWIVFVRSPTGLVLQPGSKLYIVPAEGGEARELASNVAAMNSWHSWSPNGRWLVFSGKDRSPVTELFLTHIDEEGEASPALRLSRLNVHHEAPMVPEFVPESCSSIVDLQFKFHLDDSKQSRTGNIR